MSRAGPAPAPDGNDESPFLQIGDCVFFTLSSVAPKLDGFLTSIRGHRCVVENREHVDYKEPASAFDGNLWTIVDKLTDMEKLSAKETLDSAGKGVNTAQLCKRGIGTVVTYGQSVQIMHNLSGMFLSLKRGRLETHTGELEVHLAPPHDATHFFITPGSRAREKGKPVQIADSVNLMNVGLRFQVTHIPKFTADHRGRTVLVGGSTGTLFRLHRHSVATPASTLALGDVFGMTHVVHQGLLSQYVDPVTMELAQAQAQAEARANLDARGDETGGLVVEPYLRGVDGVAVHQVAEFWQLLGEKESVGGVVKWHDKVYFKHLTTGKYLAPKRADIDTLMLKAAQDREERERIEREAAAEASGAWRGRGMGMGMGMSLLGNGAGAAADTERPSLIGGLKGLASAGKLAVGRMGDALKDTFALDQRGEAAGEAKAVDPYELVYTMLSSAEEPLLRLTLVDERCADSAWLLVPTDLTLDPNEPIAKAQVVRIKHSLYDLYMHVNNTDPFNAAAETAATAAEAEAEDEPVDRDIAVVEEEQEAKGPEHRHGVISTDDSVEAMWRLVHIPLERVADYYTAASNVHRLEELLAATDAPMSGEKSLGPAPTSTPKTSASQTEDKMLDAEQQAERVVQAWDKFVSELSDVREKLSDIMLMLLRASAGRAEDAALSCAPDCEEFLRTVCGLKIPKNGVLAEMAPIIDDHRSAIEIAAQMAPVLEEKRVRLQDMLVSERLFDVLVSLATRLMTHPLSPLRPPAETNEASGTGHGGRGKRGKSTRDRETAVKPAVGSTTPAAGKGTFADVQSMLLALAETRRERTSAEDMETRHRVLLGLARGVFMLLMLVVDRNANTAMSFMPFNLFILAAVESCHEDVGALRVLHEMFRSNVALVSKQKTPDIRRWLTLCDKRPDLQEDIFKLLAIFCVGTHEQLEAASAGRETNQHLLSNLRRIQKLIGSLLFSSTHNTLIMRFVGDVSDPENVFFEKAGRRVCDITTLCGQTLGRSSIVAANAIDLSAMRGVNREKDHTGGGGDIGGEAEGVLLNRHLAMLDLLAALCLGQGSPSTSDVQFSCPLDVMMKVLRHPGTSDDVKTRTLNVLCNAYVLTEDRIPFAIELTKYWDEDTIAARTAGGPPRDPALIPLLAWLKDFFVMISASPPRTRDGYDLLNSGLRTMLSLLEVNEFFRVEEENTPLETTLARLATTLLVPLQDSIRMRDETVYYAYVRSKLWSCRILLQVEDMLLDERLARLFILFYNMFKGEQIESTDRIMTDLSLETILGEWTDTVTVLLKIGDFQLSKLALLLLLRRYRLARDTLRTMDKITILHGEGIGALHSKVQSLVAALRRNSTSEKMLIGNREVVNEAVGQLLISTVEESLVTDPLKIEGAPSRKAQDLMRRFDIEKIIFKILSVRYQPILHPTFLRCYRFIRFYVRDNLENQNRLVPFVSLMQSQMGRKLEIARVFSELFKDNYDLVAGLREHQVLFFCSMLKMEKLPRYARLLNSLCVVSGNSARRNQLLIANFLRGHKAQTFCLYLTPEDLKRRKALVAEDSIHHDPTGELEYHSAFIDLLAATCYKRNEACQSIIRTVLGFSDVLNALTDTTLPETYKGPYWRFLQSVYLDTEPSTLSVTERGCIMRLVELLEKSLKSVTESRARIAYVRDIRDNLLPALDHLLSTFINVEAARPVPGTEAPPSGTLVDVDSVDWMRNIVVGAGLMIVSMAESVVRLAREMNFPELKEGFYQTLDRLQRATDIVDMPDELIKSLEDAMERVTTTPAAGTSILAATKDVEPIVQEWDGAKKKMSSFYNYDVDLGEAQLTESICNFDSDNLRRVVAAPLGADISTDIEFILFVLSGVQSLVGFREDWVRRIQLSGLRRSSISLSRAKQIRAKGAFIRRKTLLGRTVYDTPGVGKGTSYKELKELQEAGVVEEDEEDEEDEGVRLEREMSTAARLKRIGKGLKNRLTGGKSYEEQQLEREAEMIKRLSAGTRGPNKALQTRLNSLGATQTCIVLLSSPQPRVVYNALYALYLLLDAGNLNVQRTVLDAIRHGLGSFSVALDDFQLLHEINGTFKQVIEEAKSAPWWLSMGGGWKQKDKQKGSDNAAGSDAGSGKVERVPAATDRSYTPDDILSVSISVIKQLCEGHNLEAQDLLREQRLSSVNLISSLVQFLDALVPPFLPNPSTSPLLSTVSTVDDVTAVVERLYAPLEQVLDTLMEVTQGPAVGNQSVLINGLGVETLRDILSLKTTLESVWEDRRPDHEVARTILATRGERAVLVRASQLLLALLEGPAFWSHVRVMVQKGFIAPLVGHVNAYGELMQRFHTKNRAAFDILLGESLPMFMLLCNLQLDPAATKDKRNTRGVTNPENFMKRVGRIEMLREERTEVVYFPRNSLSDLITEKDKDKIKWSVARSTPNAKVESFQQVTEDIYETVRVRREVLSSKVKRGLTNPFFSRVMRTLFNVIVVIINILSVVESAVPSAAFKEVSNFLVLFLALFVLVLTLVRWGEFHTLEARVAAETRFRAAIRDRRKAWSESVQAEAGKPFRVPGAVQNWLKFRYKYISPWYLYHLVMIAAAVLGVTFTLSVWGTSVAVSTGKYWFAVHIIDILIQSPVLLNVLRSVTKNFQSIALTILLIVLIVYFYAIFAYLFFRGVFWKDYEEKPNTPLLCTNILMCWATIISQLPTQGDYLRERMTYSGETNSAGPIWEFIFQLSFFFLVMVIVLNILLGIIVDTFSELRELRNSVLTDMRSKCFICGLESSLFDREGTGFQNHIKKEHNMWDYLDFYIALKEKFEIESETEFDGNESYIWSLIMQSPTDTSFYPLSRAMSIELAQRGKVDKKPKINYERLFGAVQAEMAKLEKHLETIDGNLTEKGRVMGRIQEQVITILNSGDDDADSVDGDGAGVSTGTGTGAGRGNAGAGARL